MNNITRLLISIFFLTSCQVVQSQTAPTAGDFSKMVDFLPPAPNAAAIIKYGGFSVNRNTGVPNISIPLFSVTQRKIGLSVSLGYSSSGIKVDEIASRVGMGWSLNAGGVVTRTVRGTPDDINQRRAPYTTPANDWSTYNFMYIIGESDNYSGYDSEPDLFHYNVNGISGSFVLDNNMAVVQINQSPNKIYYNFTSTEWNFKVVTPDGVAYFFGGSTATEKTKRDQICGKLFNSYLATSWYLKKVEHPNGDNIQLSYTPHNYTYDNGVSQSMYYTQNGSQPSGGTLGSCATSNCSVTPMQTCINLMRTQGVLLNTVFVSGQTTIQFYYDSRQDCEDKLVSRIDLRDASNNELRSYYDFDYEWITANTALANQTVTGNDKTPYLKGLYERMSTGAALKSHTFQYNNPQDRAPRLSYSQDVKRQRKVYR